jgi:uncharacterized damage-inducible protein DinB
MAEGMMAGSITAGSIMVRGARTVTIRKRTTHQPKLHTQFGQAAVQIFAANERMNQMLIEHLDPAAWTAKPPKSQASGTTRGVTTRNIAAIFTHMHNVRTKWVRLTAPHLKVPLQLNRTHCTPQQARAGLAQSAARCTEMLAEAFGGCQGDGRIEKFHRDGWAKPWPVSPEMLCYMLAHEAHHRGQVCMLAHQLGFPLPISVMSGLWNWEKLWKECGSPAGPGESS